MRKFTFIMVLFFVFQVIQGGNIAMAEINIQMSERNNENTSWDNLYPITKAENIITNSGNLTTDLATHTAQISNLNSQINSQANGSPKGTFATVQDLNNAYPTGNTNIYLVIADGCWYYWNSSAWTKGGVYQSTGIADRSITSSKTNFVGNVGNEFFSENAEQGKVLWTDGSTGTDANNFMTDFIPVNPNQIYVIKGLPNYCWYDSNKNFISGFGGVADNTYITTPTNACYLRGAGVLSNMSNAFICKKENTWTTEHLYKVKNLVLDNSAIAMNNLSDEIKNKISPTLPKQLNMPQFVSSENYDSSFMPNYYFMGRWTKRTINGIDCMYTVNHGSKIYAKVKGTTSVKLNFKDLTTSGNPITIAYKIDGGDYVRNTVNNAPFIITGLNTNEHYIEIVVAGIKDEDLAWNLDVGCAFTGFTVDNGATIEPVMPKSRTGLFYGDSITAGCWVYGHTNPGIDNGAEVNYVEQACKLLRCDNVRAGFSGVGVLTGGQGSVPPFIGYTDGTTHTNYAGISPIDYQYGSVSENSQKPDFIVVNLGTNDSSSSDSDFQTAYQNVINRIQQKYPGVIIFAMRPFNGTKANIVQTVASNCTNTVYVDTSSWAITYTDGIHPDLNGSIVAGVELANVLLDYFGSSYFIM